MNYLEICKKKTEILDPCNVIIISNLDIQIYYLVINLIFL